MMTDIPLQQKARNALKDAFKHFDFDKSGYIEFHELGMLLTKLTESFHVVKPTDDDVIEIFRQLDINGDGKISKIQFQLLIDQVVKIIKQQKSNSK